MDGYAVCATATFGASEANPAYLDISGSVVMGEIPGFSVRPQTAARISTGGMLPDGADAVVMIEHTQAIDETTIEVHRSVAPGQHMIEVGEDLKKGDTILYKGCEMRSQEVGLLAALGIQRVTVFKKPVVGIISTGDEIVPIDDIPDHGKIRDINSYTLSGLVKKSGGIPKTYGIVTDNVNDLREKMHHCPLRIGHGPDLRRQFGRYKGFYHFGVIRNAGVIHPGSRDIHQPGQTHHSGQDNGKAVLGLTGACGVGNGGVHCGGNPFPG